MTRMKPNDSLRAWKRESAVDRILGCVAMLYCHAFMSDGERNRVQARIEKWCERNGLKVERRRI
jgi:hypothetical protein